MTAPAKQFTFALLALIVSLIVFELTPADMWLQRLLYNSETHHWLLFQPSRITSLLFYDGIKKLLVVFALAILIALAFFRKNNVVRRYRKGLLILLLSLIIVPSVTGILKATTNVGCPRDVTEFGGLYPHVRVFESYPPDAIPAEPLRCFPAGHASGGFALMALYYLFRDPRNRQRGLLAGITTGWLMGGYKMIIGDHFLSHTVVTMILAWLLINGIVLILNKLPEWKSAIFARRPI